MVEHKIINNIEHKYCGSCKKWKILDDFGKQKGTYDNKKHNCIICINSWKKKCIFENCETYVVHGYDFCKKHGGGKKCILCNTPARNKSNYCVKHNNTKCIITNCDKITCNDTLYCEYHIGNAKCEYKDCTRYKINDEINFCKMHIRNNICVIEGCNKKTKHRNKCYQHSAQGDINKCAKYLANATKFQDTFYKNKKRKNPRESNITMDDIINKYNNNPNCFWCDHPLKIEIMSNNFSQMTIDRIDNKLGHLKNNFVLSCLFCNYAKNACEFNIWNELIKILKGELNIINFKKYKLDHIISKATNIDPLNKEKCIKINYEWLCYNLTNIKWKCNLTGLPLYPSLEKFFPWDISVDRINNLIGHSKNNCQIVCRFINFGKNRMPNDEFKKWFNNRFPKCKIETVIYPREFYDKILYKDKETYLSIISDPNIKVLFV